MTLSYDPAQSIDKEKCQKENNTDDNDTSFEIDEPDDEDVVDVVIIKDHSAAYTPTNVSEEDITKTDVQLEAGRPAIVDDGDLVVASTSSGITAQVNISRVCTRDDSIEDSDCSYDSYTYSSTPTTADVADVTAVAMVYQQHGTHNSSSTNNSSNNNVKHCRRLPPPSHMQVIAVQARHVNEINVLNNPSIADDGSQATTTTDLELDNTPSISPNIGRHPSLSHTTNLRYYSTRHSIPTVLLTHPSAAFQETDSSIVELPATRTNRHQRTLSSTSHRSIASHHSVHTANTTLSITQPKSRIWTCLRWLCLRFKVNITIIQHNFKLKEVFILCLLNFFQY